VKFAAMPFDVRLKTSFNCIINGPSGSGKTTFVRNLLKVKDLMFDIPPKKVFLYYQLNQELYLQMEQEGLIDESIDTNREFPTYDSLTEKVHAYKDDGGCLVIFDDMMTNLTPDFVRIFCNLSHHESASIILLTQNLFYKAKEFRTISLNTHYMVLMKNGRNLDQISTLARQVCPGNAKYIIESYNDATKKPYSYLLLDFKVDTPPTTRVRSNIFPDEFPLCVYLEK